MQWFRGIVFWLCIMAILAWTSWFLVQSRREAKVEFPVNGEFVAVEGIKLYAVTKGTGRMVLLLHGFPYHSDAFQGLLSQPWSGHRVVAVDFPGLGLSDRDGSKLYTPEELALTVKLFLDKLGVKEVDLLGHDLGGGVALILAARYPNLVRHAILIAPDSSAGQAEEAEAPWWRWPVAGEVWSVLFSARDFIRATLQRSWTGDDQNWESLVEQYAVPCESIDGRQGLLNLERGRRNFDYKPFEERLQVPVLLLWGGQDRIVPAAKGRLLAAGLPGAQFQALPGVGHLCLEQAPEQVYNAVTKFLALAPAVGAPGVSEPADLETVKVVATIVPTTVATPAASGRKKPVPSPATPERTHAAAPARTVVTGPVAPVRKKSGLSPATPGGGPAAAFAPAAVTTLVAPVRQKSAPSPVTPEEAPAAVLAPTPVSSGSAPAPEATAETPGRPPASIPVEPTPVITPTR